MRQSTFLVLLTLSIIAACEETSPQQSRPISRQPSKSSVKVSATDAMVRVLIFDDTETNPLHDKAEIWLRGHGSWWIKPATDHGANAKNLARHQIGQQDIIAIYPDSRQGVEIIVPFMMTSEMNPNGSTRDSILITFSDDTVEVVGLPIKAATGETTHVYKR